MSVRRGMTALALWAGLWSSGCAAERAEEAVAAQIPPGTSRMEAEAAVEEAADEEAAAAEAAAQAEHELLAARELARQQWAAGHAQTIGRATVGAAALGARWRLSTRGLPRNVRKTPEGYWIGAEPQLEHLAELRARGIRVILSGTRLGQATRERFEELGLQHIDLPFGGRFPDAQAIVEGTRDVPSEEIYIHCEHGGDRSGAMLAFLLATRERWPATQALLAVAYPRQRDVRRLVELMEESGLEVAEREVEHYTGIYSAERNGGFGGLKVRGESYERLVRTTLRAMAEHRQP